MIARLALVALVASQATDTSSARRPYWVLGQSDPLRDQLVQAWIVVPPPFPDSVHLRLVTAPSAEVWFADPRRGCETAERDTARTFALPGHAPILTCVQGETAGSVRLLALARSWPDTTKGAVYLVASDPLTVKEKPAGSAFLMAAISAGIGLIAGILSFLAQTYYNRRASAAEARDKIHVEITKHLLPQLREDLELLRAHEAGKKLDELAPLNGYVALKRDQGVLAFLTQKQLDQYFGQLKDLHTALDKYNNKLLQKKFDEAERDRAGLLERLTALIG